MRANAEDPRIYGDCPEEKKYAALNKRQTGTEKEALACAFLEENGVQIVERNFRTRYGEIDLIGLHEGYLVFFEVKYRRDLGCGYPEEAVTIAKRRKICNMAVWYISTHGDIVKKAPNGVRYDVVGILSDHVRWTKNAFDHIGRR